MYFSNEDPFIDKFIFYAPVLLSYFFHFGF